jgi:hypothetical protein
MTAIAFQILIPTIGEDFNHLYDCVGKPIIEFRDFDEWDLRRLGWEHWKASGFTTLKA